MSSVGLYRTDKKEENINYRDWKKESQIEKKWTDE